MKVATLAIRLRNGKFSAHAADSVVPLLDLAKRIRDAGEHDGDKVAEVMVMSSERPFPVFRARIVAGPAQAETTKKPKK